jgi:hypothetical protein
MMESVGYIIYALKGCCCYLANITLSHTTKPSDLALRDSVFTTGKSILKKPKNNWNINKKALTKAIDICYVLYGVLK